MAIAMGLGLGADQTVPTVAASLVILAAVAGLRMSQSGREAKNLYLSIDWPEGAPGGAGTGEAASESRLDALNEVISRHVAEGDLRRVDAREGGLEVTYFVDVAESGKVSGLIDDLQRTFPGVGVSFIDQNQLPSV
jgi:hypothetical protein